jgi:L-lactate dehydrogenase complex protein LldF
MCTTIPPVHIAVTGIEKVIENLADLPPLLSLLPRSATGQAITTYVNMISSPRKPGERDGPSEVHLILLDNARSDVYGDAELAQTLRCIRCGACMNHCPVYARIGGHAYAATIPGPIGSVLEPQKAGLERYGDLPTASTLCGACGEVCPVRIALPRLLNRLRYERVRTDRAAATRGSGSGRVIPEALIWRIWGALHARAWLYRRMTSAAVRLRGLMPKRIGPWTRVRTAPMIARRSLHELTRERGFSDD